VAVVAAGSVGSVLGCLPWFVAARCVGAKRLRDFVDRQGHWLTVSRQDLCKTERLFQRHGALVLVFGRLLPGVRTLIAVPAGFSAIAWMPFIAWTALGSLIWCALLTGAGYLMENRYEQIAAVLEPVARLVLAAIVATWLVRVVRAERR
jgi:membrane protein DedA with SNARE-associated domain